MANASNTNVAAYVAALLAGASEQIAQVTNWPYPGAPTISPTQIGEALTAALTAVPAGSLPAASALSGWQVVATSGKAVALTGSTAETTLATITVPAAQMGPNGCCRVRAVWSHTDGADDKTLKIKFGATAVSTILETTGVSVVTETVIQNANATNAQIAQAAAAYGPGGGAAAAVTTAAIDTTAAVNITLTGQLETSGDTMTLLGYIVEICYAAAQ